jgi:hypothetical protein
MMVRNLTSPARHQPDHFEIAMISDANELFQGSSIWMAVTSASSVLKRIDPGGFPVL